MFNLICIVVQLSPCNMFLSFFLTMIPRLPRSTLFPYTTLFRSVNAIVSSGYATDATMSRYQDFGFRGVIAKPYEAAELGKNRPRSEEHTSELQSRSDLVCRLLLEKKKKKKIKKRPRTKT